MNTQKTEALEGVRELPEVAICCGRTECGGECGNEWQGTQAAPKLLDDPRLQQLFGDAIEGALAFGFQGNNQPPEGHWLWRFWNIGRAEAAAPRSAAPDLSRWEKARFGVFLADGSFEELTADDPCGEDHPFGRTARWVGGPHDMQLLRAALVSPPVTPSEGGKPEGGA